MVDFEPIEAPSVVAPLYAPAEFKVNSKGEVGSFGVRFEPELGEEKIWFERVE